MTRPTIVTLCGSTRFYEAFQQANYEETMAGKIVLSVGFYPNCRDTADGEKKGCTPDQKVALDILHKQKIDMSDEVLILNVGGYIGSSTRSELEHAEKAGKVVTFLEPQVSCTGGPHPDDEDPDTRRLQRQQEYEDGDRDPLEG